MIIWQLKESLRIAGQAMKEALEPCASMYDTRTLILRNMAKHSKFIRDLWSHPETTRIISEVAGISLTVVMPIEMDHTNIQTSSSTIQEMSSQRVETTAEEANYDRLAADSVVPWHYDSYPYVCSDAQRYHLYDWWRDIHHNLASPTQKGNVNES